MTVFKTFWNVVKKYKGTILLYTVMLLIFGGLNFSTNETSTQFVDSKPDVYIKNEDEGALSKNLVEFFDKNSVLITLKDKEEVIDDALFYRDVNYVIYIPANYTELVLAGNTPTLKIKSTGDYQASLAEMLLSKYIRVQDTYQSVSPNSEELIKSINTVLNNRTEVVVKSKLDAKKNTQISSYFSFASYSIMAVVIFVVCLVLSSFKERSVNKRIIVSSMSYKKHNRYLLQASFCYAFFIWIVYILLAFILLGSSLLSIRGLFYMLNAFVFTFTSLTLALFLSTLINSKEAVNGIVNVIALGSSFLCGAFVPAEWLPTFVLQIAHVLPAYWYIHANNLLAEVEVWNSSTIIPILVNIGVLFLFAIFFIFLNNLFSKFKQKID